MAAQCSQDDGAKKPQPSFNAPSVSVSTCPKRLLKLLRAWSVTAGTAKRAAFVHQPGASGTLRRAFHPSTVERHGFCSMLHTRTPDFVGARVAPEHQTAALGAQRPT